MEKFRINKAIKIFKFPQRTEKIWLIILNLLAIFSVCWLSFYNQNYYFLNFLCIIFLLLYKYFYKNKNKEKSIKTLFFHENDEIFFEKNRIEILKNEIFVHRFFLCFTALYQAKNKKQRFILFADNFVNADDFRWLKIKLKFYKNLKISVK